MPGRHLFQSLMSSSKQISAIATFVGLSVEIKESTSDIVKTPTFTSKDGFSVFEAGAIGRYSESSLQRSCGSPVTRIPRRSLSHRTFVVYPRLLRLSFATLASSTHNRGSIGCG